MSSRLQILLPFLLLLAGLSWWLAQESAKQLPKGPTQHVPDFFTEQMTTIEMDEEGKPERLLVTEKTVHYADDETTELELPRITLIKAQEPPWLIRSQRGWISKDNKEAWLRGQVFIDREAAPEIRPYHIVTSELHLQREPDYAETEQHVAVTSDKDYTEAVGMQAWLEPDVKVLLKSRVQARHIPEDKVITRSKK